MAQPEEAQARPIREPEDDDDGARHRPIMRGPLARLERELARRASFPLLAAATEMPAYYYSPCFIPAGMVAVEEDIEDIEDWPSLRDGEQGQPEEEEDGDTLGIVAAATATRWGRYRGMREQRGGAFIPAPMFAGDEDERGPGWLVFLPGGARGSGPQWPEEDDGNGQRGASLPSFPRKPSSGAALLVAYEAQQQGEREAALC
jgi:hypothetical protein